MNDTYRILSIIADSINPFLVLLAVFIPWLKRDQKHKVTWIFLVGTALSLLIVYVIQYMDIRLSLWSALSLNYSTHTAFSVSISTSIITFSIRWSLFLVPLLIAYASMMIFLEYHSLGDIFTSAFIVALPAWFIHSIGKVRSHNTDTAV